MHAESMKVNDSQEEPRSMRVGPRFGRCSSALMLRLPRRWQVMAIRLRAARISAGFTQSEAAIASGVGEKTLSSFESGARIRSMKLDQLFAMLQAYGLKPSDFFRRADKLPEEDGSCGA